MKINTYAVNCNDAWLNTEGDDISGSYVKYTDHQTVVAELEAKCAALAAENARLKAKGRELLDEACKVYEKFNTTINPETGEFMDGQTLHEFQFVLDVDTPATDAFLAEVRASTLEDLAKKKRAEKMSLHPDTFALGSVIAALDMQANELEDLAVQLRQEAAQ